MSRDAARDRLDRKARTLLDCAMHRRTLRLTCRSCPHSRLLDGVTIWWLFQRRGWDLGLAEVPRRFYCRPCRTTHTRRVRPLVAVCYDLPTGEQFPYPDPGEWKRAQAWFRS